MTPQQMQNEIARLWNEIRRLTLAHTTHAHLGVADKTETLPFFKPVPARALAENSGFLFLPTCAGTPTGTPAGKGAIIYDTTNGILYVWDGAAWKSETLT